MSLFQVTFGVLILAQAAHSIEEYFGPLWETFPAGALSHRLGFLQS